MLNIGESIKKRREEKGISALKLADEIGVSKVAIHAFERGAKSPSVNTFIAIADVLGITPAKLLTYAENAKSQKHSVTVDELINGKD